MLLLCPVLSMAQTPPVLKSLSVGDSVPDIVFTTVLNAPFTSTSLAAYKDQLLLLDFWATWCGSCIKAFPELNSLQEQFKGLMQVLLVNNPGSGDDAKKVTALLDRKRLPSGSRYAMPVVLGGEQLAQLFPHMGIPHTIWVYHGRVAAITGASEVTAAHIQAVLDKKPVSLFTKADQMDFDAGRPLIENGNGGPLSAVLYRSMFTRFLNGARGSVGQETLADSTMKRRYFINKPLLALYHYAYPGLPGNRVIADTALAAYLFPKSLDMRWKAAYSFCYEQWVPAAASTALQESFMQADLDRQFGIRSRIEKTTVGCYVLILKDSLLLKNRATLPGSAGLLKADQGNWVLQQRPPGFLVTEMNFQSTGKAFLPVVLDETGYSAPVSIDLKVSSIHDITGLQQVLPEYGLALVPAMRELPMLVLTKTTFTKTNH